MSELFFHSMLLWWVTNAFISLSSWLGVINLHYNDVIMGAMSSQITSLVIVYSTVNSWADQRKYQSSTSLAFVRGINRWPVNSPHKGPVTRKLFPFDDVITTTSCAVGGSRVVTMTHLVCKSIYGTVSSISHSNCLFEIASMMTYKSLAIISSIANV